MLDNDLEIWIFGFVVGFAVKWLAEILDRRREARLRLLQGGKQPE